MVKCTRQFFTGIAAAGAYTSVLTLARYSHYTGSVVDWWITATQPTTDYIGAIIPGVSRVLVALTERGFLTRGMLASHLLAAQWLLIGSHAFLAAGRLIHDRQHLRTTADEPEGRAKWAKVRRKFIPCFFYTSVLFSFIPLLDFSRNKDWDMTTGDLGLFIYIGFVSAFWTLVLTSLVILLLYTTRSGVAKPS